VPWRGVFMAVKRTPVARVARLLRVRAVVVMSQILAFPSWGVQ
jgi:hypothetical protein